MKHDVEVWGNDLEGALKLFKRRSADVLRDARRKRWFVSKGQLRRLDKKKGKMRWRKRNAAIKREMRRGD